MSTATPALAGEVAACLGLPAVELVAAPAGGAAHLAYEVHDPARPSAGVVAFLRMEAESSTPADYGLVREARALRAARRLGLPVAEVLGTPGDPPNLLMAMLPGTSRPSPDDTEAVAPGYLALVAELHRADAAAFDLGGAATVAEAVASELDLWVAHGIAEGALAEPLVHLGSHVLRATAPAPDEPPAVVHGDIGAGNFMVDDGRVVAMLDWELCHVGDPHEDLAWLWMRGAHTSFGDPLTRLAEYEAAAGRRLDPDRLRWHLAFVMWKTAVAMHTAARGRAGDEASLVQTVVIRTYDALLGAQLVRLTGGSLQLLAQEPVRRPGPQTRMADFVLASGSLTKPERIAVTFLRDSAAQAEWERDELVADLRDALGVEPAALTAAIDEAGLDELAALALVLGRAADRAATALPNAVRRIQRAQAIGLGTAHEPMPAGPSAAT